MVAAESSRVLVARRRWWQAFVHGLALVAAVPLVMAIAGIPRGVVAWITAADCVLDAPPGTIVVLGGEGIPSESGLMRTYTAARLHARFPQARYVCSLPADTDPETSSVGRMRDELVLRGVPRAQVQLEYRARNTHEQSVTVAELLGPAALAEPLLVVTSPTHARRSVLCFRRAGFRQVACAIADTTDVEADMGRHVFLRYGFWNLLETQVRLARELVALAYYRLRGWC